MTHRWKLWTVAAVMSTTVMIEQVNAAWLGLPANFKAHVEKIMLTTPVLAPFAYSRFCVRYVDECRVHGNVLRRPRPVVLTDRSMDDLIEVNHRVNRSIIPTPYVKANFYDSWSIAPQHGDCNDFAVTKRHDLLARGWPSRALLLAEVVTPGREHHMILVVRTKDRDLILDNLSPVVRDWSATAYKWVRIQSPYNPVLWSNLDVQRTV